MKNLQNLVTINLTAEEYAEVDAAFAVIEKRFGSFVSLSAEEKRAALKAGEKSEVFCIKTLTLMDQHRDLLPPNINVDDALSDMRSREQLRPRLNRLMNLARLAYDTELALGSDMMAAALAGYRLLKANRKGFALESLDALGGHFARKRRPANAGPLPELKTQS